MGNATAKNYSRNISVGTSSRKARWDNPGLPAPPGKPVLISGTDETQPDIVAIRWERSPSNGGSAIVGYLVEYRRLGSPHWIRGTSELCAFPELTLSGLEPGWRYQFRVRAQNALGFSQPSEISEPLTVTLQRAVAACPPRFDLELTDTVALENEQAEFVVRFSGTPLPKISWFKDGFEIFSSRRTRIITDNEKSVLLIHQTALNDEGEIKCTVTNRAGHVATRAKLILEAPARIRLPRQYEDGLLFEQDETIRLKVSLAGRPSPVVTWYHDGESISKDARHSFETMDGESVLKIPDAKRNDRGEYTVKAANKLGEDAASFLVTVTDRPAAPGKVAVAMTLGRSVTLSWKEPEDDGGCKIGTYIVEYYRIGWEVWLKATTSRRTTATLSELIEGSEYKFRVKAENPYGVSDPSEESDVIFIPDLKRRITSPLSEKSQSHREISRSRGDKREVSFTTPTQRTRSLTREEARTRDGDDRFTYDERSASAQRLATFASDRPSRADSRVTFAPDTLEKGQLPVPPARSREHGSAKQQVSLGNHVDRSNTAVDARDKQDIMKRERTMSPKPAVVVSSPITQENSSSLSTAKERRSLSPLSVPAAIQEYQREQSGTTATSPLPSLNSILKRQVVVRNESEVSPPGSPQSPGMLNADEENPLHGSSEFMLILYPEYEMQEEDTIHVANGDKRNIIELLEEDENDLIPPPISVSLPELFSARHEATTIMREAVSSTELLHERAMERFYRAVAAEEASEIAKRKMQLEKQTGELALSDVESVQRSSLRRRLSNSGAAMQNLIVSWQAKKNRRSSEGQTDVVLKSMKFLSPALLPDIEARSDPNLPSETTMADAWKSGNKEGESIERLRRWHETNVPLIEEARQTTDETETIVRTATNGMDFQSPPIRAEAKKVEVEKSDSVETSEESSEEISSADSEDLKLLKSRILARRIINEEDTYHPRGRPVPHIEQEQSQLPYDRASAFVPFEITSLPSVGAATSVVLAPSNVVPKSILKKPKEEIILQDNAGKSIPPEKPIRKMLPQPYQQEDVNKTIVDIAREEKISDSSNISETLKTPVMSESDTDSIVSAAEAAKNRRMQSKLRSATPEEEAAEIEARMAVVNQYTEIVREYTSHSRQGSVANSRRSSISEDHDRRYRTQEKTLAPTKLMDKHEQDETSRLKIKSKNEIDQRKKDNNQTTDSKKESVDSTRGTITAREKRESRPSSRDQSPTVRRRQGIRSASSSRSSSKTRIRAPSQERGNRPLAKNNLNEQDSSKPKVSSRPSSRSSSRSNSRERSGATESVKSKLEKLQRALESKSNKSRAMKKESEVTGKEGDGGEGTPNRTDGRELVLEAKKTVRSTVSYVTDLTLLIAAMYVYFFKRETLAVPFIVLLLYRRIQEEIHGWMPRRWWRSTKKR